MYYLIGGSGAPNFGDELIIKSWLEYIFSKNSDAKVVVDNNSSANSQNLFSAYYPEVEFFQAFKNLKPHLECKTFLDYLKYGAQFYSRKYYSKFDNSSFFENVVKKAEHFHLYGGGYINTNYWPQSAFLLGVLFDIKRNFDIPTYATGMGITPLNLEKSAGLMLFKRVIDSFDVFETRDVFGYNKIREYSDWKKPKSLVCGLDDTFLFPAKKMRRSEKEDRKRLHISAYKLKENKFMDERFFDVINNIKLDFDEIIYWNCATGREELYIDLLKKNLNDCTILNVRQLIFEGLPVNNNDLMITMRFHPHLMASRLGCKGYVDLSSQYYRQKHGSVIQLGSGFEEFKQYGRSFDFVNNHQLNLIQDNDENLCLIKKNLANIIYPEKNTHSNKKSSIRNKLYSFIKSNY